MKLKKLSTSVPADLLSEAVEITGLNQTQALTQGLKELIKARKRMAFIALKGKIHVDLDVSKIRERRKT